MRQGSISLLATVAVVAGCSTLTAPEVRPVVAPVGATTAPTPPQALALDDADLRRLARLAQLSVWIGAPVATERGLCTIERWHGPIGTGSSPRQEQALMRVWEACRGAAAHTRLSELLPGEPVSRALIGEVAKVSAEVLARLIDPSRELRTCMEAKPTPPLDVCVSAASGRQVSSEELKAIERRRPPS